MTFQLIAFFMVLINFADSAANQDIKLPTSRLAIPPKDPPQEPIVLQMDKDGRILYSGEEFVPISVVERRLASKKRFLGPDAKDATVIIRADKNCAVKYVREMMEMCQQLEFEKFAFRATASKD